MLGYYDSTGLRYHQLDYDLIVPARSSHLMKLEDIVETVAIANVRVLSH